MKQSSPSKPGSHSLSKSPAPPPSAPAADFPDHPITGEDIARLARSYWEARGCTGGSPEEDWLRAEQELTARRAAAAQA